MLEKVPSFWKMLEKVPSSWKLLEKVHSFWKILGMVPKNLRPIVYIGVEVEGVFSLDNSLLVV